MADNIQRNLPQLFAKLVELQCLSQAEIAGTSDGFWVMTASVAEILARRDITTVPGSQGEVLECGLFFDDWYLYALSGGADCTCGLFKMREQEHDAALGRKADGDIPGVTISFIALQPEILLACLQDPTPQNRKQLNREINRVVAYRGQHHNENLKQYFVRTEAQGAYLIANLYTGLIASLAKDGSLPVPERYASDYRKQKNSGRVPQFIEENNRNAGRVICDHETITICDPRRPTAWERLAILATHTGNTSFFSFAAEVQFHAKFLTRWANIPIPFAGKSPYASAVRADMSIGDGEFTGPTPYYRSDSRMVKAQYDCHKDAQWLAKQDFGEETV